MKLPTAMVAYTRTGANAFGSMCRSRIRHVGAPRAMAACT
ncbi:Uncharacterised protein [Mycobacteroides abscessus subsp. abscessus]|nr:Uncharacterised protein [Mycobacteroides abscessus subsp. abscessus]